MSSPFFFTQKINKSELHHAYAIEAATREVAELLVFLKESFGIDVVGNPDIYHRVHQSFGIEDSRNVIAVHSARPIGAAGKKIIIIEADAVTNEAQNALLKIFEEPQAGTHFFLFVPSVAFLLPTLRSRMVVIGREAREHGESLVLAEARKFIKMPAGERIQYAGGLAEDVKDEKISKQKVIDFLNMLEMELAPQHTEKTNPNYISPRGLAAVLKARDYANDRSPSLKQLLEYVALSV